MVLSIVLAITIVVAVIFNQVTYYVTGDTPDSSEQKIKSRFVSVAYTTSVYLTYLIFVVGWGIILYYITSEEIDAFAMPFTWALLLIGLIMFCSIVGSRSEGDDYIWGTALSGIDLFMFFFFVLLDKY